MNKSFWCWYLILHIHNVDIFDICIKKFDVLNFVLTKRQRVYLTFFSGVLWCSGAGSDGIMHFRIQVSNFAEVILGMSCLQNDS